MKTHILSLIAIAFFSNSFSQINPIRELHFHSNSKVVNHNSSNTKIVPTDFREILWSTSSNDWDINLSYCYQLEYLNNKINTKLDLDYTRKDTLYKYVYNYNNENKLIQIDKYYYNSSNASYTLFYKELYYYYNNNLKTLIVYQEYDTNKQLWITKRRKIEEIDFKGNLILSRLEEFGVNGWKVLNYFGKSYTYYNNTNKLIFEIDSVYNVNTKKTYARNKSERGYNNLDQLVEIKRYSTSDLSKLSSILKIEYNNFGLPVREIIYNASEYPIITPRLKIDSITWLIFDKEKEYYDNIQLSSIDSTFENNAYLFSGKTIGVRLDSNNSYSTALYMVYDTILRKHSRIDCVFDNNKNQIENISYTTDGNDNWEISHGNKNIITYDIDNNISEFIEQKYEQNKFVNFRKREFSKYISIDNSTGINFYKNTLEAKLYPNPSIDGNVTININMESQTKLAIKIFDLKGCLVYNENKELSKGINTVQLTDIQHGSYLVELNSEHGVTRAKLIVK
jgi:Secretion system C-terminal sorting domain